MRAVLLGGCGFIGAHLSQALADAGHEVVACDYRKPVLSPQWPGVRYIEGDLLASNNSQLGEILHDADVVFYLAWRFLPADSNEHMALDVQSNLLGGLRVLELCVMSGVRRVVFFSSGGTIYGPAQVLPIPETHPTEPRSSHAIVKLAMEKYLALFDQEHGLDYVILRPGNPFGRYQNPEGGQGVIAAFLSRIAAGRCLEVWGDGSVVRDYFHVSDLVRAAMLAGGTPNSRTVYNVGSGVGHSLRQIITMLEELVGHDIAVCWRPGRPVDVPANVLDISKARRLLGWSPQLSLVEGLRLALR